MRFFLIIIIYSEEVLTRELTELQSRNGWMFNMFASNFSESALTESENVSRKKTKTRTC